MNAAADEKPLVGVRPRWIMLEERNVELSRAIAFWIENGHANSEKRRETIAGYSAELRTNLNELNRLERERRSQ